MTKRIIAVFLVVFMILVFSVSAFAAIDFGFEICSSDGTQTLYFQESTCLTSLTVTETGALLEYLSPMDSTKTLTYTFTYNGESFSGFATSANAETAVYTVGNTYTSFGSSVSLYVVESSAGGTTSVTIPVSGAWKFHDTLVFSSLSSSLTETVNFLSDGVPYTSMLVSSGSLSYAKSTGVTHVYGVEQSMILYAPDSAYTQYAIIEYANIDSGNRTSSYFIRWFPSSSASVSSRIDNNGKSSSTYQLVSSGGYVSEEYGSLEAAVSAIQSSDTTYSWSAHPDIAYLYVTKNGTYSVNNAVPYSSINISVPNQVKTTNYLIAGNWSIVSFSERSANKIDDAEIVKVIGEDNDDAVETAGFQDSSYKTIQFGQTPQEVSAEFYSWLVRNASPLVSSIVDTDGDGYDDESYNAGQQAGYTVGFADGQSSTDSYDLGYSIGYDTGLNDGQSISQEQVYNNGYNKGYEAGYNVGKDFSKNQASDVDEIGNFFTRMISAIMSAFLYLGFNISYKGTTILTVIFFVILGLIVYALIKFFKG